MHHTHQHHRSTFSTACASHDPCLPRASFLVRPRSRRCKRERKASPHGHVPGEGLRVRIPSASRERERERERKDKVEKEGSQRNRLKEGERKRTAAKHTGGLLYLTRGAREDAAYGTGCLSRHTTKWTMLDDKNVERMMAYLESTLDTGTLLVYNIDDGNPQLVAFFDRDWGGGLRTWWPSSHTRGDTDPVLQGAIGWVLRRQE